jgi:hypothetical protein
MPEIMLKSSSPPQRCDVCHQSDQYDAERDACQRCGDIKLMAAKRAALSRRSHKDRSREIIIETIKGALITGTILGVIVGSMVAINQLFSLFFIEAIVAGAGIGLVAGAAYAIFATLIMLYIHRLSYVADR